MYLQHFQLKSQPFSEHAAVAALWQDQRMDEGLARLEYLIQSGQLGVITGPSGVGKSALLKRFLHSMLPQKCQAFYCHFSQLPSAGLLKLIVTKLGERAPCAAWSAAWQGAALRTDPGTGRAGGRHVVAGPG